MLKKAIALHTGYAVAFLLIQQDIDVRFANAIASLHALHTRYATIALS
jgi:hypothetical protein